MSGETQGPARARVLAERLAAALGDGWTVETRQADAPGTVLQAAVRRAAVGGHGRDGPLRLLLEDLGAIVTLTLFPWEQGRHWQVNSAADVDGKLPAVAAAVAAVSAAGEEERTNVADAAWRIAAALTTMLPVQGGAWDFSYTSVAYPPVYGSVNLVGGVGGDDGWQGIVTAAPRPDGVTLHVPGTGVELHAVAPADVRAHLVAIAHGVLARFDERRRHHQATLRVNAAAARVVDALRARVEPPRGRWDVSLYRAFPSPPAGHVMARGGSDYAEFFVTVDEVAAAVEPGAPAANRLRVQTRDTGERRAGTIERIVATDEELDAAIDEAVVAVSWWVGRLSASRLQLSRPYRLLRPLADVPAGAEIVFAGAEHIPREGWTRYTFTLPSSTTGRRDLFLDEGYDADVAVLRDLDLYLEPA